MTCPNLCRVELWDAKEPAKQLQDLAAYLNQLANQPVKDDALMDGYDRYLSHKDI